MAYKGPQTVPERTAHVQAVNWEEGAQRVYTTKGTYRSWLAE